MRSNDRSIVNSIVVCPDVISSLSVTECAGNRNDVCLIPALTSAQSDKDEQTTSDKNKQNEDQDSQSAQRLTETVPTDLNGTPNEEPVTNAQLVNLVNELENTEQHIDNFEEFNESREISTNDEVDINENSSLNWGLEEAANRIDDAENLNT